ncbi:hypothetical protein [Mycoplasmopsis pulmonis]|uniref:hypothetical protein n=1 Tax=Mycoplasmopsis pulmonis TaxID=2107 RepID=UPI002ACEEF62|nr:hypothetical protein [Mycoplasmopsis pulmonis]MDZ7293452.1 hypothetical protein [Mycoplasmopsis pulmonis]
MKWRKIIFLGIPLVLILGGLAYVVYKYQIENKNKKDESNQKMIINLVKMKIP